MSRYVDSQADVEKRVRSLEDEMWFLQTLLGAIVRQMDVRERRGLVNRVGSMRQEYAILFCNPHRGESRGSS